MTSITEYACMPVEQADWIEPIAQAAIAVLGLEPIGTTKLIEKMGLGGLRNLKAANALKRKLHALRAPGEMLDDCWQYSATRYTTFKSRTTGQPMRAIEWRLPPMASGGERLPKMDT